MEKSEDAITVCDMVTHELYYLNPAAQRIFGVRDYRGRKCYQALRGRSMPCEFCPKDILRHDTFHIWEDRNEYCDRHFLLKDKLMDIGDKTVRFQVAMDITKQEYVSQKTRERLEFANRIAGYADLLGRQKEWRKVVNVALAGMGEFYKADRAYLFEEVPGKSGYWSNTFEWCAPGVTPQKDNLQQVPPEAVERWMEAFRTQGSILLYNLEPLRKKSPLEWEILNSQDIQRVIAVPLMSNGQVAGFIGVDNPRYAIQDDTQIRVLASFMMVRFRRERKNWQEKQ
ncbi:GAF domain-containing protein [Anaerotignum lactatifermentans]|nr:GAF domain-containing protein [Anaerotignum lactatifermentans]